MTSLFVYDNGTRGDVVFSRAVFRLLAESGRFDLVLGACRDDAALLSDLAGPRCRIVASGLPNTVHGAMLDLSHLCPRGHLPLEVWLGGSAEHRSYQWPDILESLNAQLERLGIDHAFAAGPADVPMLDFRGPVEVPSPRRPSVYLDNARTAWEPCHFVLDFERLCEVMVGFDLLCTAPVPLRRSNLVDVSALSPPQLSRLSDRCEALVGLTPDPFNLTLTEANRFKPKALCGYDARVTAPPWDYPGNPLELLGTMDELVDFLIANVVEGAGASPRPRPRPPATS